MISVIFLVCIGGFSATGVSIVSWGRYELSVLGMKGSLEVTGFQQDKPRVGGTASW